MLTTIHIAVRDRVPTITAGEDVISHNSDYVAEFVFDEEWQDKVKTVYFVCEDGSYQAIVMDGNSCDVPMLDGEHRRIFVGVQEGTSVKPGKLKTTRPCCLKVRDSIADYLGEQIPDPTPSVYEQIIELLENLTTPTWAAVQNKPFSTLGDGLEVDENGVLSAKGGTGGSPNAVQYVEQTLTDEQKTQARKNIEASPIPRVSSWLSKKGDNILTLYSMYVGYGIVTGQDSLDAPDGVTLPALVIFGDMRYGRVDITVYDGAGVVWKGSLNLSTGETPLTKQGDYVSEEVFDDVLSEISQALNKKLDKNQGTGNAGKILGVGEDGIVTPQDKPTYTLPQATADALGGIKADAATDEDTQPVRIGADGKLKTKPTGGSSVTVDSALSSTSENPVQNKVVTAALAKKITAPATATVGQIIKVKSVDASGKPTEWEAADLPSGGGGTWTLIKDITLEEDVASIQVQNLNLKKLYLTMAIVGTSQNTASVNGDLRINNEAYFYSNAIGATEGVKRWLTSYVELIGDVKRHITAHNNNNTYQSNITHVGYFGDGTVINDLKIMPFAVAGKYIGAGTRVKIYGISA